MSSSLRTTNGFIPAKVAEGKRWYVEFYCLDPETGRLRRNDFFKWTHIIKKDGQK